MVNLNKDDLNMDLEDQFIIYLKRVNLYGKIAEESIEYIELKRAFYGGCAQLLVMVRDGIGAMSEEKAIGQLEDLFQQAKMFWNKQN